MKLADFLDMDIPDGTRLILLHPDDLADVIAEWRSGHEPEEGGAYLPIVLGGIELRTNPYIEKGKPVPVGIAWRELTDTAAKAYCEAWWGRMFNV